MAKKEQNKKNKTRKRPLLQKGERLKRSKKALGKSANESYHASIKGKELLLCMK